MNDVTPTEQEDTPVEAQPPALKPEKALLKAGAKIQGIIPQTPEEAGRMVDGMFAAGMTPDSYIVKHTVPRTDGNGTTVEVTEIDAKATKARLMIGIMKGLEIGLPPITALSNICIINNRPCLWGDGALALVQKSGKIEYIKSWYSDDVQETDDSFTAYYEIKRKDQEAPCMRTFSMGDAKRARLTGKKGPWAYGYAKRMLMMRAQAWALRDSCSDFLMGIGIGEEVQDFQTVEDKRQDTDITSLDDEPHDVKRLEAADVDTTEIPLGDTRTLEDMGVVVNEAAEISDEALETARKHLDDAVEQKDLLSEAETMDERTENHDTDSRDGA